MPTKTAKVHGPDQKKKKKKDVLPGSIPTATTSSLHRYITHASCADVSIGSSAGTTALLLFVSLAATLGPVTKIKSGDTLRHQQRPTSRTNARLPHESGFSFDPASPQSVRMNLDTLAGFDVVRLRPRRVCPIGCAPAGSKENPIVR